MTAAQILNEFARRGIRLTAERGRIIARPKGTTPPGLREAVRGHKADLLRLLSEPWDYRPAGCLLRDTLSRIESLVDSRPATIRHRVADLLAEFGDTVGAVFVEQNFGSLRYVLMDLERSVRDLIAGRGYRFEPPMALCSICKGECRWCDSPGVLRCGKCLAFRRR